MVSQNMTKLHLDDNNVVISEKKNLDFELQAIFTVHKELK